MMFQESRPPQSRFPDAEQRELARRQWRLATRALAGMTILLVDDPRDTSRDILHLWLQAFGARVDAADDGEHALLTLARRTPDLILCDFMLTGMDSVTLARRIRARPQWADITLIAVSRLPQPEALLEELRAAGFRDHLSKPYDLFGVVERLAGHRPTWH